MKKFTSLLILAFALVSCSKNELISVGGNRILLHSTVSGQTKAETTTLDNLENFEFTALTTDENHVVYIDNQSVNVAADGSCSDYGEYYWPETGELEFFAYGPSRCMQDSVQVVADKVSPWKKFKVTPAVDSQEQTDFVYAYTLGTKGTCANGVELNFQHAQTQIRLNVHNSKDQLKFQLSGWGVKYIATSGDFEFGGEFDGHSRIMREDWTVFDTTAVSEGGIPCGYVCELKDTVDGITSKRAVKGPSATNLILIPQQTAAVTAYSDASTDAGMNGAYIFVTMDIVNNLVQLPIRSNVTCCWPVAVDWEPGFVYTYNIDLSEGGYYQTNQDEDPDLDAVLDCKISLAVPEVVPWEEQTDPLERKYVIKAQAKRRGFATINGKDVECYLASKGENVVLEATPLPMIGAEISPFTHPMEMMNGMIMPGSHHPCTTSPAFCSKGLQVQ